MQHLISGHEIDDQGLVLPQPASMLVERRGRLWFDVEAGAPIRAEMSDYNSVLITGHEPDGWDGPCYGGTLAVSVVDARSIGLIDGGL